MNKQKTPSAELPEKLTSDLNDTEVKDNQLDGEGSKAYLTCPYRGCGPRESIIESLVSMTKSLTEAINDKIDSMLGKVQVTYSKDMDIFMSSEIAEMIRNENTVNGKHMIEKSAEKICEDTWDHGGSVARIGKELAGYMGMMKIENSGQELYEIGSLIVKASHRGSGIGKKLAESMLDNNQEKPIVVVSNSKIAIRTLLNTGKLRIIRRNPQVNDFFKSLGSCGDLLDDDVIMVNGELESVLGNLIS